MDQFSFKVLLQDKKTGARIGEIRTPHGVIHTPAFVPVGTQATVKSLTPEELESFGVELFFVNTYHAYLRPGMEVISKFGGLHQFMNWSKPLITDSGGFQVFSLGRDKFHLGSNDKQKNVMPNLFRHLKGYGISPEILKQVQDDVDEEIDYQTPHLVKIDDDGVTFTSHWDGSRHRFTPEFSMELQWQLGSDIHIAFDECAPFPTTHEYAKAAMERTHRWALRSFEAHKKNWQSRHSGNRVRQLTESASRIRSKSGSWTSQEDVFPYQSLYGVVQGSVFKDLREESADFISDLDLDGIAIGGVAVGESKKEMRDVCDWVVPRLPSEKPRHLLGVGEIDDIFDIVERGVDTFDCVQPTRLARMGRIFTISNFKFQISNFALDITKKEFAEDKRPLDPNCSCYSCQNFSRAYVHHLFRVRELLAYRLATIHNLHFVFELVRQIRKHINDGTLLQFKRAYFQA